MSAVEGTIAKPTIGTHLESLVTRARTGWRRFINFDPYTLTDRPDDGNGMTLDAIVQIGTGARLDELATRRDASVQVTQTHE